MVTLVGTIHVGERTYYERLWDLVTSLEARAAAVYYERIRPAAETEWAAAGDGERALRGDLWKGSNRAALALCRCLGWVLQYFPSSSGSSWRNVDMTDLELIRRAQRSPGNQEERREEGSASTDGELEKVVGGDNCPRLAVALDHFGLLERLAGDAAHLDFHGVVVGERNPHALAALSPDVDVVLIMGFRAHLRGLAAGLRKAGYRRQAIQWLRVGRVPPLWTSAVALWSGLRSSGGDDASG